MLCRPPISDANPIAGLILLPVPGNLRTVVEPGDFRILIGSSSKDIRRKGTLTVGL